MITLMGNRKIGEALTRQGLVPPNCFSAELHIGVSGALTMHFDVHVDAETLKKIADVLKACASDRADDDERNRLATEAKP